nr:hypothetical protein CFP56_36328 [Quercus suber]
MRSFSGLIRWRSDWMSKGGVRVAILERGWKILADEDYHAGCRRRTGRVGRSGEKSWRAKPSVCPILRGYMCAYSRIAAAMVNGGLDFCCTNIRLEQTWVPFIGMVDPPLDRTVRLSPLEKDDQGSRDTQRRASHSARGAYRDGIATRVAVPHGSSCTARHSQAHQSRGGVSSACEVSRHVPACRAGLEVEPLPDTGLGRCLRRLVT